MTCPLLLSGAKGTPFCHFVYRGNKGTSGNGGAGGFLQYGFFVFSLGIGCLGFEAVTPLPLPCVLHAMCATNEIIVLDTKF